MLVMSFIVHMFVALFICLRIPFVCLLNDLTEVYTHLWMAEYSVEFYTLKLYMEELRYDIRVTSHKNRKYTTHLSRNNFYP